MTFRSASFLLAFLTVAAAHAQEPAWLTDAKARESELGRAKKVRSSDKFLAARVPAKVLGRVVADADGDYPITLDVKAGSPIYCVVLREPQDLANFSAATAKGSFEAIAKVNGKIAAKAIERVDAGAIGASPFLAVEWVYRVEPEGSQPALGVLKQIVAAKDGHAINCLHDEIGYAKTFQTVTRALIESLAFDDAPSERPYRSEISTLAIKGMRVGVEHTSFTRDESGDTKIEQTTALLLPVDSHTLMPSDEIAVQWARPDGSLINAFHAENENGEVATQLDLTPRDEGGWTVSGKFKAKPLEAKITDASPSSSLGEVLALQAQLAEPADRRSAIRVKTWVPGVDPRKLVPQQLSVERALGAGRYAAKLSAAGLVADLVVDAEGSIVSGAVKMGPMRVEIERVFAEGAITAALPASALDE